MAEPLSKVIQACEFEVFGKVQRVFMRKYTQAAANQLHIRGYVMNTPQSTVKGIALGSPENLDAFKQWLQTTGSPKSRVDRVEYKDLPIGKVIRAVSSFTVFHCFIYRNFLNIYVCMHM